MINMLSIKTNKKGIIRYEPASADSKDNVLVPRVASDFRCVSHLFARRVHRFKYVLDGPGAATNLKNKYPSFFARVPGEILDLLSVELYDVCEMSNCDPETGLFSESQVKKEISIRFNFEWESLQSAEDGQSFINSLVPALWGLSRFLRSAI